MVTFVLLNFRVLASFHFFFNTEWKFYTYYRSETVKIPLTRELCALGITTETLNVPNVLQRQTELNVLQRQTGPDVPQRHTELDVPQRQTELETQSEPDTPSESQQSLRMPESIKITRPDKFDGTDTSIATVTAWTFSVEEYMELAEVPEDKQTHFAGTMLSSTAKMWYINSYKDVKPLPSLEEFIKAFKDHHLTSHSEADIIKRAETIPQGAQRGANEYSSEFKMLILQLGHKSDDPDAWVTRHYLRGLDKTVRDCLIPSLEGKETLDTLIEKAANIARNVEFGKSLDQSFQSHHSTPRSSSAPSTRFPTGTSSAVSTKSSMGKPKFMVKLTEGDREYLSNNNGCFWCRKINVDHIATGCPDRL